MGPALQFAGRFRERVNLPIFHAARIADVATARYAITEGLVDMVGMMRAHMADPHIVRKLEAGRGGPDPAVRRGVVLHQPALPRPRGAVPPQPGDRPRGDDPAVVARVDRAGATGRGGGWRAVRAGGGPRRRRTRSHRHAPGGGPGARRAGPAGGPGDPAAERPDRDHRLAGRGVPASRRGPAVRARSPRPRRPGARRPTSSSWRPAGRPGCRTSTEGVDLASAPGTSSAGPSRRRRGDVLLFDDHGTEEGLSCVERLVAAGSHVELVTPDRHVGHEVTGTAYPRYLATFYEHGVRLTPDHRLTAIRRDGAGRLEVDLWNDYTKADDPSDRRPGRRRLRHDPERRALPGPDRALQQRRRGRPRGVHRGSPADAGRQRGRHVPAVPDRRRGRQPQHPRGHLRGPPDRDDPVGQAGGVRPVESARVRRARRRSGPLPRPPRLGLRGFMRRNGRDDARLRHVVVRIGGTGVR